MKKTFVFSTVLLAALFVFANGTAFAHGEPAPLPSAGLTPDSPFYFLDRISENLRELFTFNPEAKAKLQIEFAGERIAEIKVMVEKKGDETKGIEKAKSLLVANVAHAAEIVSQEKASGKDVAQFAKDMNEQFDAREKLLTQTFLDAREKLIAEHKQIKDTALKEAEATGDTAKVAELTQQLNDIQNQADDLKDKKDEIKTDLRTEKKKIEQEMNQEDQQNDQEEQIKEDTLEQDQEGDQGEFELNQEDGLGENSLEQKGEQELQKKEPRGKIETNQPENQGKQENNEAKNQEDGNQERD